MKAFADFPAKVTGQASRCKASRTKCMNRNNNIRERF